MREAKFEMRAVQWFSTVGRLFISSMIEERSAAEGMVDVPCSSKHSLRFCDWKPSFRISKLSGVVNPGCSTPQAWLSCRISFLRVRMKLASFADLSVGSRPRMSHAFCVATPVGHFPV